MPRQHGRLHDSRLGLLCLRRPAESSDSTSCRTGIPKPLRPQTMPPTSSRNTAEQKTTSAQWVSLKHN